MFPFPHHECLRRRTRLQVQSRTFLECPPKHQPVWAYAFGIIHVGGRRGCRHFLCLTRYTINRTFLRRGFTVFMHYTLQDFDTPYSIAGSFDQSVVGLTRGVNDTFGHALVITCADALYGRPSEPRWSSAILSRLVDWYSITTVQDALPQLALFARDPRIA